LVLWMVLKINLSEKSIRLPRGQKNPQNNLPKIAVIDTTTSTIIEYSIIILRDAMKESNPGNGLMRRNHLPSIRYAVG
jgi:hypothetical protein